MPSSALAAVGGQDVSRLRTAKAVGKVWRAWLAVGLVSLCGCVRSKPFCRGQGRGQMGANLVGQGAGGGLKAWSAERERCNLFAAFKAPLTWLADRRLSPKAAVGCAPPSVPLLFRVFPGRWLAKVVGFPAGLL